MLWYFIPHSLYIPDLSLIYHRCSRFTVQFSVVAFFLYFDKFAAGIQSGTVPFCGVGLRDFQFHITPGQFQFAGTAVSPGVFPLERRLILFDRCPNNVGIIDWGTVHGGFADLEPDLSIFNSVDDQTVRRL